MVNLPPEPENRPVTPHPRDNDEAIAVVIALLAIGSILGWVWSRDRAPFLNPLQRTAQSTESRPEVKRFPSEPQDLGAVKESDLTSRPRQEASQGVPSAADVPRRRGDRRDEVSAFAPAPRVSIPPVAPVPLPKVSAPSPAPETPSAVPNAVAPSPLPQLDISDVPPDHWAYPFIVDLYEKGLLPNFPEGQLKPDQELTRAEFAALLHNSFVTANGQLQPQAFNDLSPTYWANNAIQQVVAAGYMKGYPENLFKPAELVPRYQVWVTLATGLGLPLTADPEADLQRFQGVEEIPDWAKPQVAAAANNGLVARFPDPKQLDALKPATRGEIIVMIHQALLKQGRVDEISSPYIAPRQ